MSDLDDEELRATRKLNGVAWKEDIKQDVNNLEIGTYVRTKKDGIRRIDTINKNKTVNKYGYEIGSEWDGKLYSIIKTTDIIKHSPNLIDLIEVNDYVNGYRVLDIMEDMQTGQLHLEMPMDYTNKELGDCTIYNKDIETIVTREQFNSVMYKVKE